MRINQFLASAGLGSRRACEQLVRDGKVRVGGKTVENLATEVEPTDDVRVSGRPVRAHPPVYILLHKPPGVLTTCSDERSRKTVVDFLPESLGRIFPVGRLDKDSEGLLLLTNDGELMQHVLHPSNKVEKEYEVRLDKALEAGDLQKLLAGFLIEGGRARIDRVQRISPDVCRVILHQGIKRQIRLMFHRLGYEVLRLKRLRVGPLLLKGLAPAQWRPLTAFELRSLRSLHAPSGPVLKRSRPPKPARVLTP